MTDEKDKINNVVVGPWGKEPVENNGEWIKDQYSKALERNNTTTLKMQEKLVKIDTITEGIMVQLIHTLSEHGYDITDESFILDIGFLSESIKGVMSRQEKLPHVIQGLVDNIMTPEETQTEDGVDLYYSRFDAPLLADLVEMAEDIKMEDYEEVVFESDTELQDNSEKDKEGTLHELRNKKINKDDEEKDD
tara:strand:+ start:73 stop:648 length:576 start_codon:yes stop_codon:yes gene_type:complete